VKLVVLTPLGEQTKAEMIAGTYTPPPELLELDRAELVALRDATAPLRVRVGPTPQDAAAPASAETSVRASRRRQSMP
jgi:hypothetical protein